MRPVKTVAMTSLDGGVGKTTLSAVLAVAKGYVPLVDMDWEKADLSQLFRAPRKPGWLAPFLEDGMPYLHRISPTLYLMPCYEAYDLYQRHGRDAVGVTHLELTRGARNVIYVVDEAHRFLAFANRYSLLTDHLRTGRALGRFFVLVSHSYREFTRHIGYVKLIIRFPDWDMDETKTTPLQPSEAIVTIMSTSLHSMEALSKFIPLRGTWGQFRMTAPPFVR